MTVRRLARRVAAASDGAESVMTWLEVEGRMRLVAANRLTTKRRTEILRKIAFGTSAQHVLTYCLIPWTHHILLPATMTTAAAAPQAKSNNSKVRRNLGLLFGCGVRSKQKNGDAALTRSSQTKPKPTVDAEGKHKQPEENKAVIPPSPATTVETDASSLDDVPNMDDPATTSTVTATNAGSGTTFSFGGSSMERRITQVIFSFLLTFLTLGMAGRSDSKKAIATDDSKSPESGTESKKEQDEVPKQVTWSKHAEAFSQ